MYEEFDIVSFLMGLPLAIILIGIIALYNIKKGRKNDVMMNDIRKYMMVHAQ